MKILWAAAVMAAVLLAGCESAKEFNPYKVAEKNINNAKNLRVGMTKAEALAVMGEPLSGESFNQPDLWFYYFDVDWLDGLITEDECFPLVFRDGKLIGWGNHFYTRWRLENKDRIPNVELPPEASTGSAK